MRNAIEPLILAAAAGLALAACSNDANPDQNVIITDNVPANADVEALPPDEGSGTTSDELANGADNADVGDLNSAY